MKKFDIPINYSANIIDSVRKIREKYDPRKKDLSPSVIKIDKINFYIGRHFGFCYGVKNAIEICYNAIKNHPNKKIYLLSEMIHNQLVNQDLQENGISFIMDTKGQQLINWNKISNKDIYNSLTLISEYMKKNIFIPNNINFPNSRKIFINQFK